MAFKTLAEIKAEISREKARQQVDEDMAKRVQERKSAKRELFKLKHRKFIGVASRFGRGTRSILQSAREQAQKIEARRSAQQKAVRKKPRRSSRRTVRRTTRRSSRRLPYAPFGDLSI